MEDDWVVDSLVGFLKSPVWQYLVENFTEQKCIVFDKTGGDEAVYTEIYTEYQTVIEKLLNTFMSDLGITEEQLTDACSKSKHLRAENEKLFQPLLASQDYDTFQAMMIQKNIDLELQALQMLQNKLGQSLDVYQPRDPNSSPSPSMKEKLAKRDAQEERDLEDALQLSLKESDLKKMADDAEMEKLLELAIQESLKLYQMQEAEQDKQDKQVSSKEEKEEAKSVTQPIGEKRQVQLVPEEQTKLPDMTQGTTSKHSLVPLTIGGSQSGNIGGRGGGGELRAAAGAEKGEITGEQAAQLWLQSAKMELENRQSPLLKQRASKGLPSDLKARERYLKEQRNRLLESKKKQREEVLKRYKETHPQQSQQTNLLTFMDTSGKSKPKVAASTTTTPSGKPEQPVEQVSTPTGGKIQSRVLCSVILKKLKEEEQTQ